MYQLLMTFVKIWELLIKFIIDFILHFVFGCRKRTQPWMEISMHVHIYLSNWGECYVGQYFICMHQSILYMNRVYWYNMAILWLSHSCSVSKLSSDVRKHMVFMYVSMYIAQNSPLPLLTNYKEEIIKEAFLSWYKFYF